MKLRSYFALSRWLAGLAIVGAGIFLTQPALAQVLGNGADESVSVWRVLGAFVFCAILAVAGAIVLKHRQGAAPSLALPSLMGRRSRRLQLVENLRLNPHAGLCIVVCDGSELLVSATQTGVRLVGTLPLQRTEIASSGEESAELP
ncbi:MAG TPA: flagellar biosynthetic protein FliO [Rhizomicrobium sp.]|jgi:hypothetical protein